jgi:sugar transferase (PEP-CTERM system associated)
MGSFRFWHGVLITGDLIWVVFSVYLAQVLRHETWHSSVRVFDDFTGASTIYITVLLLILYLAELYDLEINRSRIKLLLRLFFASIIAVVTVSFIFYWIPGYRMYRLAQIYCFLFVFTFLALWRLYIFRYLILQSPRRRILIAGAGQTGTMILATLKSEGASFYDVVGFLDDDPALRNAEIDGAKVLGGASQMLELAREHDINLIVFACTTGVREPMLRALMNCKINGLEIRDAAYIYKSLTAKVPIMHVGDSWFIFGPSFQLVASSWNRKIQRLIDIGLSLGGLILSSPIMLLSAMAIKIESRGPVIFSQVRLGLHEKPYTLFKFRTMVSDAEKLSGPIWAERNDPRVTQAGRFLRRTRIDELPQLWNIFKGEMSFIGPRPERPEFVEMLKKTVPYYSLRFTIKPGLTGWAQVNYGYGGSREDAIEKLQYELYYLQEMSLFLNLVILFRTAQTVLFHRGS